MDEPGELEGIEDGDNYFRQLEKVNTKLVQLVQLLINRLKGPDEDEYEYSFGQGWTPQKHDDMKEKIEEEDPGKQLEAVKKLLRNYKIEEKE